MENPRPATLGSAFGVAMPVLDRREELSQKRPACVRFDLVCPDCGSLMRLRLSRFGRFYGCTKWAETKCGSALSAKDDGTPKGFPVKKHVRKLRREVLDLLAQHFPHPEGQQALSSSDQANWVQTASDRRKAATSALTEMLGFPFAVGQLDEANCRKVIAFFETQLAPPSVWDLISGEDYDDASQDLLDLLD